MKAFQQISLVIILAFAVVFVGCDSNNNAMEDTASVSLSIVAVNGGVASKGASAAAEVTAAKALLRTIQFHARDDGSDEDSLDFRSETMVAELNLDASPLELAVSNIPFGTYHKVSFRIHKPDSAETPPDSDFKIGESGDERFSVIVDGMYDANPFTYRSSKSMQQKVDFEEDLVVDETTGDINVTLLVDVSTWFKDRDGNDLDPTDDRSSNTSEIDKSIRESFRIFKDNNKDGEADS